MIPFVNVHFHRQTVPCKRKSGRKHSAKIHHVQTQTPQTKICYEFDEALYHLRQSITRQSTCYKDSSEKSLYLPTIIDVNPKPRKFSSHCMCTCKARNVCTEKVEKPKRSSRKEPLRVEQVKPQWAPVDNYSTPVLAVAIRRKGGDEKSTMIKFNGLPGYQMPFDPFKAHRGCQTSKSYVHVEFDIDD